MAPVRDTDPTGLAVADRPLGRLREQIDGTSTEPYLLSVTADGRPHCVTVQVAWDGTGDRLTVRQLAPGASTPEAGHHVSLLWPPPERGGYSLIVDGVWAAAAPGVVRAPEVFPTKAVLHRGQPASNGSVSACPNDCIVVLRR